MKTYTQYRKILVVRFSSLGDVMLVAPVLVNLKNALPETEIVLLTKRKYAALYFNHPSLNRIITIGDGISLWSAIQMIKQEKFDLMIDLHNTTRSWLVRLFGNIKHIVVYSKDSWARRVLVYFKKSSPKLQAHTVDKYLETLAQLGIPVFNKKVVLFPHSRIPFDTTQRPARILVIQTAFLGDTVLTAPLFESIKKNISCQLTVLTTPHGRQILNSIKSVDEWIVFDKKGADRSFIALIRLILMLWRKKYDIALIPHRSFKSAFIAWMSRIPHRVGFSNSEGRYFLTHSVPFDWDNHDSERNLSLLFPLGITGQTVRWGLTVDPHAKKSVDRMLGEKAFDHKKIIVGLNPGSIWPTKRWPAERFAAVAEQLGLHHDAGFIIFGGKEDSAIAEHIIRQAHVPLLNLCGATDLLLLPAFIERCSIFITNDSGPMHIAVALHIPTIAIFGPTTKELGFYPYGEDHQVIEVSLPCRPCGLHGSKRCPLKHFKCMNEISVERVASSAHALINKEKK